jgi:Fe-S cluster assembly ATP-binding protein
MLTLKNISVTIDKKPILKNISYTFEKEKIYAIMGPNGSGKSTLAHIIMGNPLYALSKESEILFRQKSIKNFTPDKRAKKGIFLSFQSPLALTGVTIYELLHTVLAKKKNVFEIKKEVDAFAQELQISKELLQRPLNEGASGGERKKMEILQAAVLDTNFIIFDEIDTGVDIDSLKVITRFLKKISKKKTFIIITHYNRILEYLKPDKVIIMLNGKFVKEGNASLAKEIEEKGYIFYKDKKV